MARGSPRPISAKTPSSETSTPASWLTVTRSRKIAQAATMMISGSNEFSTPTLIAMVYCSDRNRTALPPTMSRKESSRIIQKCRRMR